MNVAFFKLEVPDKPQNILTSKKKNQTQFLQHSTRGWVGIWWGGDGSSYNIYRNNITIPNFQDHIYLLLGLDFLNILFTIIYKLWRKNWRLDKYIVENKIEEPAPDPPLIACA